MHKAADGAKSAGSALTILQSRGRRRIIGERWSCWAAAKRPTFQSFGWVLFRAPRLLLSLSANLSGERCKIEHLTEFGLKRFRLLRCKKLDIINQQHFHRLFNTVRVCFDQAGHADNRSLALISPWRIQLEICHSVQTAKGS